VHLMKSSPSPSLREPNWELEFNWAGESDVRRDAAAANAACLGTYLAVPGGLFEDEIPGRDNAARLQEVMLVWAGGSNSPHTGGWLGLPVLGERPWLAVQNIWWHKPGAETSGSSGGEGLAEDNFSMRDLPKLAVSLKRRAKAAER
jgi:hypothetical protein